MLYAGIGFAFLAGIAAAYGYHTATKNMEVVAAKTTIPANTPIAQNELTTLSINETTATTLHAVPYSHANALVGHDLTTTLPSGLPIMGAMLSTASDLQAVINQYAKDHNVSGLGLEINVNGALLTQVQAGDSVMLFVQPSSSATTMATPPFHLTVPVLQAITSGSGSTLVVFLDSAYLQAGGAQAVILNSLLKGNVLVAPYSANTPKSARVYVPGIVATGHVSVFTTSKQKGAPIHVGV